MQHSPYERIPTLLTTAERDFFVILQQVAPTGHLIFAQVRLANLVQVKPWARRDKSHWWRIQAKCVDFVLVDAATFAPRLVIELDDSSHDRADRRDRDAFVDTVLAGAGIRIFHIRWQRRYDSSVLAGQIAGYLGMTLKPAAPVNPECQIPAEPTEAFWRPIAASSPTPTTATLPLAPAAPHHAPPQVVVPQMPAPMRQACGQCQNELRDGAKFCAQCGAVFAVAGTSAPLSQRTDPPACNG